MNSHNWFRAEPSKYIELFQIANTLDNTYVMTVVIPTLCLHYHRRYTYDIWQLWQFYECLKMNTHHWFRAESLKNVAFFRTLKFSWQFNGPERTTLYTYTMREIRMMRCDEYWWMTLASTPQIHTHAAWNSKAHKCRKRAGTAITGSATELKESRQYTTTIAKQLEKKTICSTLKKQRYLWHAARSTDSESDISFCVGCLLAELIPDWHKGHFPLFIRIDDLHQGYKRSLGIVVIYIIVI